MASEGKWTKERAEEVRERAERATPHPWSQDGNRVVGRLCTVDIPDMLTEIERLNDALSIEVATWQGMARERDSARILSSELSEELSTVRASESAALQERERLANALLASQQEAAGERVRAEGYRAQLARYEAPVDVEAEVKRVARMMCSASDDVYAWDHATESRKDFWMLKARPLVTEKARLQREVERLRRVVIAEGGIAALTDIMHSAEIARLKSGRGEVCPYCMSKEHDRCVQNGHCGCPCGDPAQQLAVERPGDGFRLTVKDIESMSAKLNEPIPFNEAEQMLFGDMRIALTDLLQAHALLSANPTQPAPLTDHPRDHAPHDEPTLDLGHSDEVNP
jgi:hypothetical protein